MLWVDEKKCFPTENLRMHHNASPWCIFKIYHEDGGEGWHPSYQLNLLFNKIFQLNKTILRRLNDKYFMEGLHWVKSQTSEVVYNKMKN